MVRTEFRKLTLSAAVLIVGCFVPIAPAQEAPTITRADLATAYLRLEQALDGAELDEAVTIRVNRAFDSATLAFFGGKLAEAIQQINELTASIENDGKIDPAVAIPASFRVTMKPIVYIADVSPIPELVIERLYPAEGADTPLNLFVEFTPLNDTKRPRNTIHANIEELPWVLTMQDINFPVVRHGIDIGLSDGESLPVDESGLSGGFWSIVSESLDPIRTKNGEKLASIAADSPPMEQALASCKARNDLLSDNPSPENTAQMLFDPAQLAGEIESEIASLAEGNNPYAARKGDYWRVLKVGEKTSPMRVYLPESAPVGPLPLVIAFHGAGGDENMFMDAYGNGIIKRLADERGFLLVSPRTYDYSGNMGEMFDALIDALAMDYEIDRTRIFAVGHSMGGGAVNNLVNARGDKLAAAAALCGFRNLTTTKDNTPPMLVVAAELDPIAQPARIEPGAQKAIDEGLPVEYKLAKNYGHTLVVGDIMPETIEWMFAKADVSGPKVETEAAVNFEAEIRDLEPQPIMAVRFQSPREDLPKHFSESFGAVFAHVISQGKQPKGMPLAVFHSITPEEMDVEAGVAVEAPLKETDKVKNSKLPGGRIAFTRHMGPYEGLPATHEKLEQWLDENGHEPDAFGWEIYVTDPGAEPDTSKWVTEIYRPIK